MSKTTDFDETNEWVREKPVTFDQVRIDGVIFSSGEPWWSALDSDDAFIKQLESEVI